jgi:hypothetical protein
MAANARYVRVEVAAVARRADLVGGDQLHDRGHVVRGGAPDGVGRAAGGDLGER